MIDKLPQMKSDKIFDALIKGKLGLWMGIGGSVLTMVSTDVAYEILNGKQYSIVVLANPKLAKIGIVLFIGGFMLQVIDKKDVNMFKEPIWLFCIFSIVYLIAVIFGNYY